MSFSKQNTMNNQKQSYQRQSMRSWVTVALVGMAGFALISSENKLGLAQSDQQASAPGSQESASPENGNSEVAKPLRKPASELVADSRRAMADEDYQTAAEILKTLRVQDSVAFNTANGYLNEGRCYYQMGNYALAEEALRQWEDRLPAMTLGKVTDPSQELLHKDLLESRTMRADALYHMGVAASDLAARRERFNACILLADGIVKSDPTSYEGTTAQLLRLKSFMQMELMVPNPDSLDLLAEEFEKLAQVIQSASFAESGKLERREAAYYAARCRQRQGDYLTARSILQELLVELNEQAPEDSLVPYVLSTLGENHLAMVVQPAPTQTAEEKADEIQAGFEAYRRLRADHANWDPAAVSYNLGTLYLLNAEPTKAVDEFQSLQKLSSASQHMIWSAMLKEAQAQVQLAAWSDAAQLIPQLLSHVALGRQDQQARAVQLGLELANQQQDFQQVQDLYQKYGSLLSVDATLQQQGELLNALAQTRSTDAETRTAGWTKLDELSQSDSPLAFQASWEAARSQYERTNRVAASRPRLDDAAATDFQRELSECAERCLKLLESNRLNVSDFPKNPRLIGAAELALVRQRQQVQTWLAQCYLRMGKFEEAERQYQQLLSETYDSPDGPDWTMGLADALVQQEKVAEAVALLEGELNQPNLDAEQLKLQMALGQLLERQQQFDKAALAFEKVFHQSQDRSQSQQALLNALFNWNRGEQYGKSIRLADQAASLVDRQALPLVECSRGISHFYQDDFAEAIKDFESSIKHNQELPEAQQNPQDRQQAMAYRALALDELKDPTANDALLEIVRQFPESQDAVVARQRLRANGQPIPAMPSAATDSNSETRETTAKVTAEFTSGLADARAFQEQGEWSQAATRLQELVDNADPQERDLGQAYFELGYSLRRMENWQPAISNLESALNSQATDLLHDRAAYYLGDVYFTQADFERATDYFSQAANSASTDIQVKALYMQGWSLHRRRDFDQAVVAFAQLLDLFPEHRLADDSRLQLARNQFYDEKWADAYENLAEIMEQRQQWASAQEEVATRIMAGKAALAMERFTQAKTWLEGVQPLVAAEKVSLNKQDATELLYQLAVAHRGLNENAAAESIFTELASTPTDLGAQSLDALASLAKEKQDWAKASVRYRNLANGAFGAEESERVRQLKANAALQRAKTILRLADETTVPAEAQGYREDARKWLERASIQTDDADVATEAKLLLSRQK